MPVLAASVVWIFLSSMSDGSPQEKYIKKYAPVAVSEMYRSGVPASITLAQGLLESGAGLSTLATKGNNHFGIKCHNWTGRKVYYDDDEKNECFRAYDTAEESFRDHSDFLRYRDRYKFLFENETTDYKAWAYGLKKAGYATDPGYPAKLIKYIEDYGLSKYDKMSLEDVGGSVEELEKEEVREALEDGSLSRKERRRLRKMSKAEAAERKSEESKEVGGRKDEAAIPESPLKIESPERYVPAAAESFKFSLSREMFSRNGVPYVNSLEGETLESIAKSYNLFLREILKFNDLTSSTTLSPGAVVYLQPKKNRSEKGLDAYVVDHDGESLRDISQRFAVKLDAIYAMNGFSKDYVPREGDKIILRGKTLSRKNKTR